MQKNSFITFILFLNNLQQQLSSFHRFLFQDIDVRFQFVFEFFANILFIIFD